MTLMFELTKADEAAREKILELVEQAWPIWPTDDDGEPIGIDVGCVNHWVGISDVSITSCTHLADESEIVEDEQFETFEVEAKIARWESGNPIEDLDGVFAYLETYWVVVAFDGESYFAVDREQQDQLEVDDAA